MPDNKSFSELFTLRLEDGEYLTEIPPRNILKKNKKEVTHPDDKILEIIAPIPGVITAVFKKENEFVKSGQTLLRLEAMKMENEITSSCDGKMIEVKVKPGVRVSKNEVLIVIKKN